MSRFTDLDRQCVNALRALSIDQPQAANSGHPGLPLGASPMAYVLWQNHLKHDPTDPAWPDRDRFVLSGGHGSALLYSLLNLTGYDLPMSELENFRQWGSKTPGHPESHLTPGVEAVTGPLGQGISNAVGMAIAERWLAHHFNRPGHEIVDHWTYVIASDGDLMEGVAQEASAIASFYNLGRLIVLYDSNQVTLDGPLSQSTREDTAKRYEAYGWHVVEVEEGNTDLEAIDDAIEAARADTGQPSLVIVDTTIGYGSPNKAGTHQAHGEPLGEEEVVLTKKALGWEWPNRTFYVPAEVRERMDATERGRAAHAEWKERLAAWAVAHPDLAEEWRPAPVGGVGLCGRRERGGRRGEGCVDASREGERARAVRGAAGCERPAGDGGELRGRTPPPVPGLAGRGDYVVLHPGATAPARAWPAWRCAEAVEALHADGHRVLVTGHAGERELTARVAGRRGVDLGGATSFAELAGVLRGARAVVVGNTGPAHLAAAVGTPVVSLFAPVVPVSRWAPYRVPAVLLGDQTAACRDTRARNCPVPGHPCLSSVTAGDVVAAVRALGEEAA